MHKEHIFVRTVRIAQWHTIYLAHTRPWVQFPAQKKNLLVNLKYTVQYYYSHHILDPQNLLNLQLKV